MVFNVAGCYEIGGPKYKAKHSALYSKVFLKHSKSKENVITFRTVNYFSHIGSYKATITLTVIVYMQYFIMPVISVY